MSRNRHWPTNSARWSGFIAVAPDLLSGRGPKGGNFDAFPFPDDALRANLKLSQKPEGLSGYYKAAYDYAMKLPRSKAARSRA